MFPLPPDVARLFARERVTTTTVRSIDVGGSPLRPQRWHAWQVRLLQPAGPGLAGRPSRPVRSMSQPKDTSYR